jgi:hypothetical protein
MSLFRPALLQGFKSSMPGILHQLQPGHSQALEWLCVQLRGFPQPDTACVVTV